MPENHSNTHVVRYRTFVYVLISLVTLTFISVLITHIDLGRMALTGAILIAAVKSSMVLWYFMHVKYESRFLKLMIVLVLAVYVTVLVSTLIDFVLM